jgi:pyruvate dehydrogenase E1 component beta subunit
LRPPLLLLLLLLLLPQMVREGTDVSIFTYSRMRYVVMQAVAELEKKGYNPEVG